MSWTSWTGLRVGVALALCALSGLAGAALVTASAVTTCDLGRDGAEPVVPTAGAVRWGSWLVLAGAVAAAAGPLVVAWLRREGRSWPWAVLGLVIVAVGLLAWAGGLVAAGSPERLADWCAR
ncbi:MAG: hypothetical protein IPM45_12685 [Acidimicrobiales bacterium]|nr:hypothetical protein [Acidimicrobiales bacterium]